MVKSPNVVNKHKNTIIREMLFHAAYEVMVHNIAGTRDNNTIAAQEEPTSTTERWSSTGQSNHSTPGPRWPSQTQTGS
jgi:hypothetical protein